MNFNFLKNILINKKPIDDTKEIEFLNPENNKKFINDLISYSSEKDFYDYLESDQPTKKQLLDYYKQFIIKDVNKNSKSIEQKAWLIKATNLNQIIGSVKLCDFSLRRKSLQWGYGLSKKFRNNNYLIKIQLALIKYIFDQLKFNRIWGHTYINNKRVINGQRFLQFRNEGVKYQFFFDITKKKFVDAYSYSFLKEDYHKLLKTNLKKKQSNNSLKIKNDTEILRQINKIICKILSIKSNYKNNIQMKNVSNWDSLNHFNIISTIEKKFQKKFNSKQLFNLESSYQILIAIKN